MKISLRLGLIFLFSLILSACEVKDPDQNKDLEAHSFIEELQQLEVTSFAAIQQHDSRFSIVYIYEDDCEDCEALESDIVDYLQTVTLLPVFVINRTLATDQPRIDLERGVPVILLYVDGVVKEKYEGTDLVEFFMDRYGEIDGHDYKHFIDHVAYNYADIEHKDDYLYIAYYYSDECGHCQNVKEEILGFFSEFEYLPFYMLDVNDANDYTSISNFPGTPTLIVFEGDSIKEAFVGTDRVREFITKYSDLDYTHVLDQHIRNYEDMFTIEQDDYYVYYYSPTCSACESIKEFMVSYTLQDPLQEVFFLNVSTIEETSVLPEGFEEELAVVPTLLVFRDGQYTNEYYQGTNQIIEYIESITE